jgi:hypothetical protein
MKSERFTLNMPLNVRHHTHSGIVGHDGMQLVGYGIWEISKEEERIINHPHKNG